MIKNYLLITVRGMMKNKLFIVINVFGMAIAIACAIVAYLSYDYDVTFDRNHQHREKIYRVSSMREFDHKISRVGFAPLPLGEIVDKTFPDVTYSSRLFHSWSNFKREDDLFASNLYYVDADFFKMFSWQFLYGDPAALADKTSVFISDDMATRLFHSPREALGKTMTQVFGNNLKEVKIAGIFKAPPANSSFFNKEGVAYMNFENCKDEHSRAVDDNWQQECTLFVMINDPRRVSGVHQQLQQYIANNNRVREDFQLTEYALDPLTTMASVDRAEEVRALTWQAPPLSSVMGSLVMATLLVLIACFNLTNTAIAISSRRLKEIGLRKVMGSMRIHLIAQFIGETTFICLMALVVALAFSDALIAGWNIMTSNNIHLDIHNLSAPKFIFFLTALLFITGLLAGSYPAFYISKFEPVKILKGKVQFGGTNYFTRILLVLQFTFSLIAVICAVGFFQNAQYQKNYDLGFDIRGAIVTWVNNRNEFETYRDAVQSNPNILSIAGASSGILSNRSHEPVKLESQQAEVDIIAVGDNYLKTMNLTLLEGRDFNKDSETDEKESIIITQKMADMFGWEKPLGKQILWKDTVTLYVVGVVKDVYTRGLWRELEPMMIRYASPDQYTQLVVTTTAANVSGVNDAMRAAWNKTFPNRLYNGHMLVSELKQVIDLGMSIMYVYAFLGIVAMLLSATGLFTLLSLNVIKRMKEIGVRKVLGASMANISKNINTEFVIVLTIASILGSWASYNMSNLIMSSIWKYYQGVNVMTFVASVGLLFAISFITIGYKVMSVANMNPVNILRDE